MILKTTNTHKCVRVYYKHGIPPTFSGHSCGNPQGGALKRTDTSKCFTSFLTSYFFPFRMAIYYIPTTRYTLEWITNIFLSVFQSLICILSYVLFNYHLYQYIGSKSLSYFCVSVLCNAPTWGRPHECPKHVEGIRCV
jgi:hypothetical protein